MSERARVASACCALGVSAAAYVALAVVLGSVPAGFDGYAGFSLPSVALFSGFTHLPVLHLSPAGFSRLLSSLFVLLWALWGGGLAALRPTNSAPEPSQGRGAAVAGCAALLALVVVLVPPVLSADLYRHALYGRMVAVHGLDPYAMPASAATGDLLLPFANYRYATTSYGPAYTWLSAAAAWIVPAGPLAAAMVWKAMTAAAALGAGLVGARVARQLGAAGGPDVVVFIAGNPLVVIESAGSGHNEAVMMAAALGGLALALAGRPLRGFGVLVVSTLTKWMTGLLLVLHGLREIAATRARRRPFVILRLTIVGGVVAGVLYAPFMKGLGTPGGVHELALHGAAYLGDASRQPMPQIALIAGFTVIAIATLVAVARRAWSDGLAAVAALMLLWTLAVVPWIFPWYFVPAVMLAGLLPPGRVGLLLRCLSCGLGAGFMLYYARLVPL